MTDREALCLVLELAQESVLSEYEAVASFELFNERGRQIDAVERVQYYLRHIMPLDTIIWSGAPKQ